MSNRWWPFTSILSTAVAMSAPVAHLMELPPKMGWDQELYVRLHRTLYPNFGRIAGMAEFVAVISTAGLAWWTRKRAPSSHPLTVTAAALWAASHTVFWTLIHPANTTMASWPLDSIPAEWAEWRSQWEYSHAVRAFLATGALAALVLSVLPPKDTPELTRS